MLSAFFKHEAVDGRDGWLYTLSMENELNFKNLIKLPSLADEWEFIINESRLSGFPKEEWDFRLAETQTAFPKERTRSFCEGIFEYAQQKERGEAERLFVYSEEERRADKAKEKVVIYLHRQKQPSPLAIIAPGGAYQHVAVMNEGFPVAKRLYERGYSTAILVYSVGENANGLRPHEDVKRTFELLGEYTSVTLWGFSASGHLCGSYCGLAKKNGYPLPRSLMLGYPVVTFDDKYTHAQSRLNFFGHEPSPEEAKEYSLESLVTRDYTPTYLWHCEGDAAVPVENSVILDRALTAAGAVHKLRLFPNGAHGLGAAVALPEAPWLDDAIDFCDKFNK